MKGAKGTVKIKTHNLTLTQSPFQQRKTIIKLEIACNLIPSVLLLLR